MDWDSFFMNMACLTSLRSKDPETKVGTCIVNDENRIISVGYNGFPDISDNDNVFPWTRPSKYLYVIHSELNAILNSDDVRKLKNTRVYCTHFPCNECTKALIQVGIKTLYYLNDKENINNEASWYMFNLANVDVRKKTILKKVFDPRQYGDKSSQTDF
ncbi:putative dCMP deaminase [Heterosigma akashiwo virus 01]|jgi:dCMP deaminase|uniref:Putative dCMP deaminase n=1 Tax=Heterosigma akashiwo virus 01 TaxID=97195 RepID=A0A1C9C5G7_HAV01|nr:putative dCMP deaminase [Heterosigma akashiwo virus 01]AOM63525.1 putative dCMP deaminase [Heterosigma akashiwo virus 01]